MKGPKKCKNKSIHQTHLINKIPHRENKPPLGIESVQSHKLCLKLEKKKIKKKKTRFKHSNLFLHDSSNVSYMLIE